MKKSVIWFAWIVMFTLGQVAKAEHSSDLIPLPDSLQLRSILETIGLAELPPFDFSISADKGQLVFTWKAVCFPKCESNFKIHQLTDFFKAFGFSEEQQAGITRIEVTFDRKNTICYQAKTSVAAIGCTFDINNKGRLPKLILSKEDGTSFNTDTFANGFFRSQVTTRVIHGFSIGTWLAPYLMSDMHLSLVGHEINGPDAAYAVINLRDLPVGSVVVNGVENP